MKITDLGIFTMGLCFGFSVDYALQSRWGLALFHACACLINLSVVVALRLSIRSNNT